MCLNAGFIFLLHLIFNLQYSGRLHYFSPEEGRKENIAKT